MIGHFAAEDRLASLVQVFDDLGNLRSHILSQHQVLVQDEMQRRASMILLVRAAEMCGNCFPLLVIIFMLGIAGLHLPGISCGCLVQGATEAQISTVVSLMMAAIADTTNQIRVFSLTDEKFCALMAKAVTLKAESELEAHALRIMETGEVISLLEALQFYICTRILMAGCPTTYDVADNIQQSFVKSHVYQCLLYCTGECTKPIVFARRLDAL